MNRQAEPEHPLHTLAGELREPTTILGGRRDGGRGRHEDRHRLGHRAGIDYRERLAEQLNDTVFAELNALATRLAAEASRTQDLAQRAGLLAEADTVAGLLARLRTMLFTLDPPRPTDPTC